jgi:hypothetical protein
MKAVDKAGARTRHFLVVVAIAAGCGSKEIAADAIEDVRDIDLAKSQAVDWIGLPASGMVHLEVHLEHAKPDLSKATGTVRVSCPNGCALGDGKTKLMPKMKNPRNAAFLGDGIDFGTVGVDSFDIGLTFADGTATITTWNVGSKDIDMIVTGTAKMGRTLEESTIDACIRFAPTKEFETRSPQTAMLLAFTGASRSPKDGLFNIQLGDKFGHMKRYPRICDGSDPGQP